jgi:hypothetical protein
MTKIGTYDHAVGGELIVRDMTEEEIIEHEETKAAYALEVALEAEKAAAKAALLDRLGITADEAALLLG